MGSLLTKRKSKMSNYDLRVLNEESNKESDIRFLSTNVRVLVQKDNNSFDIMDLKNNDMTRYAIVNLKKKQVQRLLDVINKDPNYFNINR
tara:strand:- start:182 stop:451 length:270 start_codon:yes stop_codon:yes gene_type:complete